MNNIIFRETLQKFSNLKNSKGEFTEKNQFIADFLKKCVSIDIGNSFEFNSYVKKHTGITRGEFRYEVEFTKDFLKLDYIVNLCNNLTAALIDRSIVCFYNKANSLCIKVLPKQEFKPLLFIVDKNSTIKEFEKVYNPLTQKMVEVTTKGIKGKRVLTDSDISEIRTAFKAMGIQLTEKVILQKK